MELLKFLVNFVCITLKTKLPGAAKRFTIYFLKGWAEHTGCRANGFQAEYILLWGLLLFQNNKCLCHFITFIREVYRDLTTIESGCSNQNRLDVIHFECKSSM